MKIYHPFFALFVATVLIGTAGCNQETDTDSATDDASSVPSPEDASAEDHGHEHATGEGHDEGHSGGHGAGPHEGTLADWGGGKYHVEFTVNHDKQQATVYIVGGDEKSPAPIDAKTIDLSIKDPQMQVTLDANPLDSDPDGKASRFVGTDEKLGTVQEYAGTITGVVDGTPYSGDFQEVAHRTDS